MTPNFRSIVLAAGILVIGGTVLAQAPAPQPTQGAAAPAAPAAPGAAGAAAAAPPSALPSPPANYVYSPDGRRDPFSSLINRGTDAGTATDKGARPEGVAGLQTSEISVKGIVLSRGVWAALVSAPDGKMYTVRAGDRLADGMVRAVTAEAVVILQDVNDPLSLEKQREVRKLLRGGEEVK